MTDQTRKVLRIAKKAGVLRPRDLAAHRISRSTLQRLAAKGQLERVSRGLYIVPGADVTEHHSLAEACKRVPRGVVCLLSALRFHDLTTQAPFEVWLALNQGAREPVAGQPPLRTVRMSGKARTEGIEEHRIEGVTVKVYSAAKTVSDCFKFRNKLGLDVALEALRDYLRSRGSVDELWRCAKVCRVTNVMRPYLEVLV